MALRFARLTLPLCIAAISLTSLSAGEFAWKTDEAAGTSDLTYDGKPVLRYMFAYDTSTPEKTTETFKVFHHVFGMGEGKPLLTNGAGGLFPHHRGMYVGWNKTSWEGGVGDFWHCTNGTHQRHVKFVKQDADAKHGEMTSIIHWNAADGKPVIVETRTVSVKPYLVDQGKYGWQIDWTSKLESQRGEIALDGDRQHAGFQFRAANSVAEKNSATYIRPANFPDQPAAFEVDDRSDPDKHADLGWLAMQIPMEGQTYTVGYLEDPSLPKPSRYSERPYGRFGAFFKTTLKPDAPLTLRYRVIVTTEDKSTRETWQKRYDEFVKDLKAK